MHVFDILCKNIPGICFNLLYFRLNKFFSLVYDLIPSIRGLFGNY